jgi:hypothetical protein
MGCGETWIVGETIAGNIEAAKSEMASQANCISHSKN